MLKTNTSLQLLVLSLNKICDSGAEAPPLADGRGGGEGPRERQGSWRIGCRASEVAIAQFLSCVAFMISFVMLRLFECVALRWGHRIDLETLARRNVIYPPSCPSYYIIMLFKLINLNGNILEIRASSNHQIDVLQVECSDGV